MKWKDYTEEASILFTTYPHWPGSLVVMPRWYYLSITLFQKGCPQREMPVYSGHLQKLVNLIRSHLFTFVFIYLTLGGGSYMILPMFSLCFPVRVL